MLNKTLEVDFLSIGAPLLGNMEGCSFPRAFKRRDKFLYLGPFKWAALSIGALLEKLEGFIYWVF